MTTLLNDIRPVFDVDLTCDCLHFEVEGYGETLEYLDRDGTLCAEHESNLSFLKENFQSVRRELENWIKAAA